jgi:putative transposase
MTIDGEAQGRRSIRLPGYDYASGGAYFVTTVTKDRECLFENPVFKGLVEGTWQWLAEQYKFVQLDEFVVMPNHFHGVLMITDIEGGPVTRRGEARSLSRKGQA